MENDSGGGGGGTLLVLEPKSLRSFTTNDEYLYAMKEDLAEWFSCLYKMPVDADNFMEVLETGVVLCRHANEVQIFFKERRQQGAPIAMRSYFVRTVPEGQVTCRDGVKPGTFQARDNVSNFITWCKNLGIPDVLRFETDDLVLRKNEKSVILCMLELARVGAKLGMLAPTLVQMEQEIDEEIESGEPPKQIKTCDMKSLDELVRELVGQCTCPVQFPMVKVGEGKYKIGDSQTLIFVRVLRNHVMVRVGGGWDTLENYLNKHDPCRCRFAGHRGGGAGGTRHQVIRRASTPNVTVTRSARDTPTNVNPTSPRRMSTATAPGPNPASSGATGGERPAFSKGPSPIRSASPTPGNNVMVIRRLPSPATPQQQQQAGANSTSSSSSSNISSSRPSGFARAHSPSPGPSQQTVRNSHEFQRQLSDTLSQRLPTELQRQSSNDSNHSLRQSSDSGSVRQSLDSPSHRRASLTPGCAAEGSPQLHRQASDYQLRQSHSDSPIHRQMSDYQLQNQQSRPTTPQHQAVQRCKSPSPGAGTRCVSPALSGNRTLPRPIGRPSGIPRPQSPAPGAQGARRKLDLNSRSVSFDTATSPTSAEPTSRSTDNLDAMADIDDASQGQDEGQGQTQGEKSDISIDQISTMTLSEFKKLISSSLSVPGPGEDGGGERQDSQDTNSSNNQRGAMRRSQSAGGEQGNLSWSSVRDKARSVCNSIASSVSARRPSGAAGIIARRNLPRAPSSDNRPKTPSSVGTDRPKTPSAADRPKTPVSTYRPKTPTSAYAYRPKTPSAANNGEEGGGTGYNRPKTPSRPKTPTSIGASAQRTNNSYSNNSRDTDVSSVPRPKTPSSSASVVAPRVQNTTIVSTADADRPIDSSMPRVKNTSFVYNDDTGSADKTSKAENEPKTPTSSMGARTASWTSSTSMDSEGMGWGSQSLSLPLSRRSQSPADDLDGENDEIAEAMNGERAQSGSGSIRDRPPTPSRIPKPCFTPRPASPPSSDASSSASKSAGGATVRRVLPRPSTPVGRSSVDRQTSDGGEGERPPPSPRKQRRSATPVSGGKSYMEMYQQRRAATPGPTPTPTSSSSTTSAARPTTPGPGGGVRTQQQMPAGRRGSLSKSVDFGQLRKAKSVTSLVPESGGLSVAGKTGDGGDVNRARTSSAQRAYTTDSSRRLQRQNACDGDAEGDVVLMVSRGKDGSHSVRVTDQNENVTYSSASRSRLQQSNSLDGRPRSKTPGPGVTPGYRSPGLQPRGIISRKLSVPGVTQQRAGTAQYKATNRTEAWVDSTLNDPKRKQLPPRPKRAMTPNSLGVHESELLSRPLEEIQAVLPSPDNYLPMPDPEALEAPPEDPEMYRKMEQLFEKYREMELRASVCDTPGGGGRNDFDNTSSSNGVSRSSSSNVVGGRGSSGRGGGESVSAHRNSVSSRSNSSLRTNLTTTSGSLSSGVSSGRSRDGDNSSRGTSVENDRFSEAAALNSRSSREASPAAAAATPTSYYSNGAASYSHNHTTDQHSDVDDNSASVLPVSAKYGNHHTQSNGAPAVSAEDIVDDIPVDPELIASNPTVLVSKIKEILKVRPRKEDTGKTGTRSRIPAPASLSSRARSKSMSNLLSSSQTSLHTPTTPDSAFTDPALSHYDQTANFNNDMESTNSDVSSDYSRCETPVPKLAQPLTTGRSTLIKRERSSGALRAMSQDDRVSTSSSHSSSSARYWYDDGEYV